MVLPLSSGYAKFDVTGSSETLIHICKTMYHTPETSSLNIHCLKKLESRIFIHINV
jgi:hypothetical protein